MPTAFLTLAALLCTAWAAVLQSPNARRRIIAWWRSESADPATLPAALVLTTLAVAIWGAVLLSRALYLALAG